MPFLRLAPTVKRHLFHDPEEVARVLITLDAQKLINSGTLKLAADDDNFLVDDEDIVWGSISHTV